MTSATNYTGHFDWYQGVYPVFDSVHWATGDPIKWAYYQAPSVPPVRAYPRDSGYCLFYVPHFNALSTPTCTLYYYQASHSGSANLLVNTWVPYRDWPPPPSYYDDDFFAIWNSHDTVATDVVHSTDGAWYKVPLTVGACAEIRDTAATYQNGGNY